MTTPAPTPAKPVPSAASSESCPPPTKAKVTPIAAVKWPNGPWVQDDGYEYLLVLAAIGVTFAFTGAGQLSLDAALGTGFAGVGAGVVTVAAAALTPLMPRRLGSPG